MPNCSECNVPGCDECVCYCEKDPNAEPGPCGIACDLLIEADGLSSDKALAKKAFVTRAESGVGGAFAVMRGDNLAKYDQAKDIPENEIILGWWKQPAGASRVYGGNKRGRHGKDALPGGKEHFDVGKPSPFLATFSWKTTCNVVKSTLDWYIRNVTAKRWKRDHTADTIDRMTVHEKDRIASMDTPTPAFWTRKEWLVVGSVMAIDPVHGTLRTCDKSATVRMTSRRGPKILDADPRKEKYRPGQKPRIIP